MTDQPFQNTLSYLIVRVAKAHRNCAHRIMAEAGLHVGQEMILMQLWREDGQTLSQLVERLYVQPATITKMLNRMEKSGFVKRRPDPEDKRAKRIYLTDAARAIQHDILLAWGQLDTQTTQNLSENEQATLHHLLTKILDGLESETQPICD